MKTVREWLNELPEEIRERAISNAYNDRLENRYESIDRALKTAFSWIASPEGGDFWADWHEWFYDPTQPKPTIKPADEVVTEEQVQRVGVRTEYYEGAKYVAPLSRRDQFAMAAMQAMLTRTFFDQYECAENAVEYADALIQELDKQQP
jgi:hypothetical protein